MNWYLFATIAVLFSVAYGLISKRILNDKAEYDPISYASLLFISVSIISFVVFVISGGSFNDIRLFSNPYLILALLANVTLYSISPLFYYKALKNLPLSEVTILYSLAGLFALAIGIAFNLESFYLSRLFGGTLIIGAIMIVTKINRAVGISKYTWIMIIGTFFYACAAITDNIIISSKTIPQLLFQAIAFGVPAFLVLLLNPKSINGLKKIFKKKTLLKIVPLNAVFFFVSYFGVYSSYSVGGTPSQVNLFLAAETIVTVIFSALLLKERKSLLPKVLAGILTSVGVYLLR